MKFSIQEAGGEKQIFFTFKEASEKTGLTSKNIARVLKSGRNKYFRRSDKKTFWIQNEEITPFIQIDGEDFFLRGRNTGEIWNFSNSFFQSTLQKTNAFFGFAGEIS